MKKTVMLLAVLALLAVPATAQTYDWSQPGSTGNLHQSTYNEIMRSRARAEMLARLASQRDSMPICNTCEF